MLKHHWAGIYVRTASNVRCFWKIIADISAEMLRILKVNYFICTIRKKTRKTKALSNKSFFVFFLFVMVFGFYREFERFSFLCWVNLISFIVSVPCASCVALSTVSCLTCSRFLFYFGDSVFNVSPVAFFCVKVVLLGYNLFCFVIYNYTLEIWLL